MIYTQLTRFLLPLVLTAIALEFSGQFLNGGMARMPQATETLASYGLAWGIVLFLTATMVQVGQISLVLVDSQSAYKKAQRFVLISSLLLATILAILALSPVGVWVVEKLHSVSPTIGTVAREALFWLIPIPVLFGFSRFYSGLLIRVHRTEVVSFATLVSLGLSILSVFVLLPTGFVRDKPILLPILVTYVNSLVELGIELWGYRHFAGKWGDEAGNGLSYIYILRFYWPLALIMAIQGFSRPLINLFVSREADGAEALAVLTIVYALGHIPYGWLNEIRNLAPAFKNAQNSLVHIRRFAAACGLVSFSLMVVLFWTPLRDYILEVLLGLDPALATQAQIPLLIFTFFPLAVTTRAYFHGIALIEHRTKALAPSAPSRIAAILAALIILPLFGIHGVTRGVAALYSGFVFETLVVWWGIRGRRYLRQRQTRQAYEHGSY